MSKRLTGLIAAPFTAFHADGKLNLGMIKQQAELLRQNKVAGAFVCGTTGEGVSLSLPERQQIAEKWREWVGPELAVIVHVGHTCQEDACQLASHAQQMGAAAIAAVAPYFFQAASPNDLVDFFAPIAGAAPDLPFYYYHIPSMS